MDTARTRKSAILISLALTMPVFGQEPAKPLVDLHGDPLPKGAIARLGTVRFRHAGAVCSVAFSADGRFVAASNRIEKMVLNMVVIWERATGRKFREIPVADRRFPASHLRFSPDGTRLYGSFHEGENATLSAWNVETGAIIRDLPVLPAEVRFLNYSPDGREVILLHKETEIVRWDIEKGKDLERHTKQKGEITTAAWWDHRLFVPHFDGQTVTMWDVAQKKYLWSVKATRDKHDGDLPMSFSAGGKLFAVEAPARIISVHESLTGKVVSRFEVDGGKSYQSLRISPDGRTIAGSYFDGSLRLWNLENGKLRAKISAIQGVGQVFFAPDSKTFATGGYHCSHTVFFWETATGKQIDPFPGHPSPVRSISFSPDGKTIATSSLSRGNSGVRLWDPQCGQLLRSLDTPSGEGVGLVAFSPDGRTLATCGSWLDTAVRLWDTETGRELHTLTGHQAGCTSVAFSPDGKRLASGDLSANKMGNPEGRLCIWDTASGQRVGEIRGTKGFIHQVLFTRDGRHVLAAADGVHVYNADSGTLVGELLQPHSHIWRLALSANGQVLATMDNLGPVRFWELASRREIPLTVPGDKGYSVAFAPDGRTLAFINSKGDVVLLHWPSGTIVGRLSGNGEAGLGIVFSPDSRQLARAKNAESSVLIWDVAGMVNCPLPVAGQPSEADLRRWWADLRDPNPGKAYQAIWRFAAAPEQALPFLAKSLQPVKMIELAAITHWIKDLDSDAFKVRETASRELKQLGEGVVDVLQQAKKTTISMEQARRLDELLEEFAGPLPGPDQLRTIRAVAALGHIGTPEARQLLGLLAAGSVDAHLTREAKAALERLKRACR